ncbi:expressed unknown protein [Seminavis robusta]|uniref:Uncharacterized protein n=1 Tax=Seminavis robusta TaxID=568900 RepID=A0A9N8EF08_9STRA|nr:expressed unknown protein [Seminavis robusta]|eukprot:Sro1056_g236230.1 n/a (319) ;mRNA; f:37206-38286
MMSPRSQKPRWLLSLVLFLACTIIGCEGHRFRVTPFQRSPTEQKAFLGGSSTKAVLVLRGGDAQVSKEFLSDGFLGMFFSVNRLATGVVFTFLTGLGMKLFHEYEVETPSSPANKLIRFAGISMVQDGILSMLAMKKGIEGSALNQALGISLVPLAALLLVQEARDTTKSSGHRQKTLLIGSILGACAVSLISGSGLPANVAAITPILLVGVFDALCLFFPETMITLVEAAANPSDHQFRFMIRAIATHSLVWLSIFTALWNGQDMYKAFGYGTLAVFVIGSIVCLVIPDMRKSGAPTGPMIPFQAINAYISYRFLKP